MQIFAIEDGDMDVAGMPRYRMYLRHTQDFCSF